MIDDQNRRILAIDDNKAIHDDLRKVLGASSAYDESLDSAEAALFGEAAKSARSFGYEVDSAFQGEEGYEKVLQSLEDERPYAAAFIDVRMPPGWDGIETARRIWEVDPRVMIVICTAYSDHSWEQIVLELGNEEQFLILKKPFDNIEVRQLAASLTEQWRLGRLASLRMEELDNLIAERTAEIAATRDATVFALARIADSRDHETGMHIERIRHYTQALAEWLRDHSVYGEQIDEEFLSQLYHSSPLHDIGKVGIPDSILLKPGRLTPDEFEIMKRHTVIGAEALEEAASVAKCGKFLHMAAEVARQHHERFDGTGYPDGLAGQDIALPARIVAVADVFDALTSERVYKEAMDAHHAREVIESERGRHFDPIIVDALIANFEHFSAIASRTEKVQPLACSAERAITTAAQATLEFST